MSKYLLYLILPLLVFISAGCEDEKDVIPINLHLLDGIWEVADQGNQAIFERGCMLDLSTNKEPDNLSFGGIQGRITTFYLTVGGTPLYDKDFAWSIREMENHLPLLDLVQQGDLDSNNPYEEKYSYTIIKLSDTHMWWQERSGENNSIIRFRRRTDIGRTTHILTLHYQNNS